MAVLFCLFFACVAASVQRKGETEKRDRELRVEEGGDASQLGGEERRCPRNHLRSDQGHQNRRKTAVALAIVPCVAMYRFYVYIPLVHGSISAICMRIMHV